MGVLYFYSAKANSFYRDDFCGKRTISVPDPDWVAPLVEIDDASWSAPTIKIYDPSWVRPLISIPDPNWSRPLVEINNPEWDGDSKEVSKTVWVPDEKAIRPNIDAPDENAIHPEIEVPDENAKRPKVKVKDPDTRHPYIEVDNPKCTLPPANELVEVTYEEHVAIMEAMATSYVVLSSDDKGRPITHPGPGQTPEQILSGALLQRDRLIAIAAARIAPLQDAVDLEDATAVEVALLKKWKQYRVAVNRVPDHEGFPTQITWPPEPQ